MKTSYVMKEKKVGPWKINTFKATENVICAERRLKWYDEERFSAIKRRLHNQGYMFFWNEAVENRDTRYTKHTSRVEIYSKSGENYNEHLKRLTDYLFKNEELFCCP